MGREIIVGCCGWSYLRENEFETLLKEPYASKLQAYARLFDAVEVNSTFYRIPKVSTAEKWRDDTSAVNRKFQFTVKAYQGITHRDRFGKKSRGYFDSVRQTAEALKGKVIVFQSPGSFHPTPSNVRMVKAFFAAVDRGEFVLAWEPRGKWLVTPQAVVDVCEECSVAHCVDPFRNRPFTFSGANVAYFRLHGFGISSMYNYNFSSAELSELHLLVKSLPHSLHSVYVFFNNVFCYSNGRSFLELLD